MAITLFSTGTEYLANAITLTRGTSAAITGVGVYHTTSPTVIPTVAQFTMVTLVKPGDALADGNNLDVLSLIGSKVGAQLVLTPGDYYRWILIQTASEDILRKVDLVTVI